MKTKLLAAALGTLLSGLTWAAPPHLPAVDPVGGNATLWSITFFDDTSNTHTQWATQNICMLQGPTMGTHSQGLWYSTTYNRWIGRYTEEGNQVHMIGDFWTGAGKDAMTWSKVTSKMEGYGHWQEWVEDGAYGNWFARGNTKLVKLGECDWKPPVNAAWADLEKMALEESMRAPKRFRKDGSLAYPNDRDMLPLQ